MKQTNTAAKKTAAIATAETSFSRYAEPLIAEAADQASALEGEAIPTPSDCTIYAYRCGGCAHCCGRIVRCWTTNSTRSSAPS
ncbi:hypothetical protein [Candidatus Burkholderia verschuerenii]|uniref:hypothetical protein n=1 Tax=Candidatus Burkholderia verschuerenii TaxID=242163 RepID=UPI001E49962D|nr:hypothetical protein [Candidatus Burkholderia verschuerenii]